MTFRRSRSAPGLPHCIRARYSQRLWHVRSHPVPRVIYPHATATSHGVAVEGVGCLLQPSSTTGVLSRAVITQGRGSGSGVMREVLATLALALPCRALHVETSRRRAIQVTAVAGTGVFVARAAVALDPSLTDEAGRLIVDPQKAARGLEDPLAETVGAYGSIGAAMSVAPSGSTIVLRPGMYHERITITKPLCLLADHGATIAWKTDKPYEAAITVALSEGMGDGATVRVAGLTVRHSSPSIAQNYAVYVPQPQSASADRVHIEFRDCDISSATGSGVGIEGGDVTLASCAISGCKNHGILYVGSTARGLVSNCLVEKCKLNGVLLRDGASPTLKSNRLSGNGQYGVSLFDCRGSFEPSNEARGNGKGSISGECDIDDLV